MTNSSEAIDGPLLQRSSTVVPSPIKDQTMDINVTIAQEVPSGFTGAWIRSDGGRVQQRFSNSFNDTIPAADGTSSNHLIPWANIDVDGRWASLWYDQAGTIEDFVHGCNKSCKATIRAPALAATSCSSTIIPVNYTDPVNITTELSTEQAPPLDTSAFIISHSLQLEEAQESINLVTVFGNNHECAGFINYTACTLVSAIGDYPVLIEDDKVALSSLGAPDIVALANNSQVQPYDADRGSHPSTLGGIVSLGMMKWDAAVSMYSLDGTIGSLTALEYGDGQFVTYREASEVEWCWNFTVSRLCLLDGSSRRVLKSVLST